jgi:hypothetical protein
MNIARFSKHETVLRKYMDALNKTESTPSIPDCRPGFAIFFLIQTYQIGEIYTK